MRSIHAYTMTAETLAAEYERINVGPRGRMTREEKQQALRTHAEITEKIAEAFEADNPRGFDKDRFFDDVYGETRP